MLFDRVCEALAPHFALERELGCGGMGVVYRARDTVLDRPVAVKVLLPERATAVSVERFLREARLLARLRHPAIVSVHQAGQAGDFLYFAMDLVEGETLESRLRRGPLSAPEIRVLARDLLSALAAAHAAGIIHRDVKPGNIFCQTDRVLLADFGIARTVEDTTLTLPGATPGTVAFMAPEQRSGHPVTPATDVHAAGLVLHHAATGAYWPDVSPEGARGRRPLPRELRGPVRRALALQPAKRWPDAAAFRAAVGRAERWRGRVVPAAAVGLVALLLLPLLGQMRGTSCVPTDPWVPATMLPAGRALRCQVLAAEVHYDAGDWSAAERDYRDALAGDPTCSLCAYRLMDIARWLERPRDPELWATIHRGAERLLPAYRTLIAADSLPNPARLHQLEVATRSNRDFHLAWYFLGEEQYHRGPLYGRSPADAAISFRRALQLKPAFRIPWTDLALLHVALGDSASAAEALLEIGPQTSMKGLLAQRAMAELAFAFRFGDGERTLSGVLSNPDLRNIPELAAGPRLLPAFAVHEGAVQFGRALESGSADPRLEMSGLAGQIFGHAARGRPDSLEAAGQRLTRRMTDPVWPRLLQGLRAMLTAWDPDHPIEGSRLVATLIGSASQADIPVDPLLRDLSRAWHDADAGRVAEAIALTDVLIQDPDRLGERDPFLRSMVYLSRAHWFERLGMVERARREYRWHRHFHVPDASFPQGIPMAAEVDWAFGPLAEWRLVELLGRAGIVDRDLCDALALVGRVWSDGDDRHRSRAGRARQRLGALPCEGLR